MTNADPSPVLPPPLPVAAEPIAVEAVIQGVRFCRDCGGAWDPIAQLCPACSSRPAAMVGEVPSAQQYDVERRSVFSAVWLYFSLLAVSVVTMIAIGISGGKHDVRFLTFAQIAMSVLIAAWAIKDRALLRGAFSFPNIGWLLLGVPVGIVTFAFAHGIIGILHTKLHVPILDAADDYKRLPYGLLLGVLAVCVQPAFFEELGFRGLILSSLQRALTTFEAITVTALIFAILHLTVLSMPHLVALGWMAGWLRTRSGSLYPAMVLHFTHNALVLASDWYGGSLLW